jgi:hypothetical protein
MTTAAAADAAVACAATAALSIYDTSCARIIIFAKHRRITPFAFAFLCYNNKDYRMCVLDVSCVLSPRPSFCYSGTQTSDRPDPRPTDLSRISSHTHHPVCGCAE